MTQPPFIVSVLIDQTASERSMPNTNYNIYDLINSHFVWKNKFQHVSIKECKIFAYNDYPDKEIDTVVKLTINIEEIMQDRFIYEIF